MADTTTPPPEPQRPAPSDNRFFSWMRSLGIQREPGWIGGVAAGIATRLGVDPLIVRGIIVVVAILGGPALLVYAAAWLLLPDENDSIHLERLLRGVFDAPIAGIGVLALLSVLPITQGFWFAGSAFWGEPYWGDGWGRVLWTVILIGLAVWLVVWIAGRGNAPTVAPPRTDAGFGMGSQPSAPTPPPSSASPEDFAEWRAQQAAWKAESAAYRIQWKDERDAAWRATHEEQLLESARQRTIRQEERRLTRSNPFYSILVIGLALLAGGLTTLSLKGGELEVTTVAAGLAVALAVLALGMLVNGLRGKRAGGAAGVAAIILLPLIFFTLVPENDHLRYGNSAYYAPTQNSTGEPDLFLAGVGDVTIDLRDYYENTRRSSEGWAPDTVYVLAGSANILLLLPDEYVSVDATSLAGSVRIGVKGDYDTPGHSASRDFNQVSGAITQALTVHVYTLDGTITITNPEMSK